MAVKKISEQTRQNIRNKTAYVLDDSPASVGMKAEQTKPKFYEAIVGANGDSIINEMNRIVEEINTDSQGGSQALKAHINTTNPHGITPDNIGALRNVDPQAQGTLRVDGVSADVVYSGGKKVLVEGENITAPYVSTSSLVADTIDTKELLFDPRGGISSRENGLQIDGEIKFTKVPTVNNVPIALSPNTVSAEVARGIAKEEVDKLVGSAPSNLDTIKELAEAVEENQDVIEALQTLYGDKVQGKHIMVNKSIENVDFDNFDPTLFDHAFGANWQVTPGTYGCLANSPTEVFGFYGGYNIIFQILSTSNYLTIDIWDNAVGKAHAKFQGQLHQVSISAFYKYYTASNKPTPNEIGAYSKAESDSQLEAINANVTTLTNVTNALTGDVEELKNRPIEGVDVFQIPKLKLSVIRQKDKETGHTDGAEIRINVGEVSDSFREFVKNQNPNNVASIYLYIYRHQRYSAKRDTSDSIIKGIKKSSWRHPYDEDINNNTIERLALKLSKAPVHFKINRWGVRGSAENIKGIKTVLPLRTADLELLENSNVRYPFKEIIQDAFYVTDNTDSKITNIIYPHDSTNIGEQLRIEVDTPIQDIDIRCRLSGKSVWKGTSGFKSQVPRYAHIKFGIVVYKDGKKIVGELSNSVAIGFVKFPTPDFATQFDLIVNHKVF